MLHSAALLYLFAASKTDQAKYLDSEKMCEDDIDFSCWDDACDWFVLLAANDSSLTPVRKYLSKMIEDGDNSTDGKLPLLIKAWNLTLAGEKLTESNVALHYVEDEDGFAYLDDAPVVGGIDIGSLATVDEGTVHAAKSPTKEEIRAKTEPLKVTKQINGEAKATTKPKKEKEKETKGKNPTGLLGKTRWTINDGGEPYQVRVVGVRGKSAICKIANGFQGAGSEVVKPFHALLEQQPVVQPSVAGS